MIDESHYDGSFSPSSTLSNEEAVRVLVRVSRWLFSQYSSELSMVPILVRVH